MADNTQLVQTAQNLKNKYSPNFVLVNDTTPQLKMFGDFLDEMRFFNIKLLEAVERLGDVVAVNTTYTKDIKLLEEKKEKTPAVENDKEKEKSEFNKAGGNYHKVYAEAIASAFQKGGFISDAYKKYTPDAIQTILGGAFSAGKGVWNLNKKLRRANTADKEAKEQKKAGKKFDAESGTWVAKEAPQGENKKEKGKLSKAISGLTSFLKKGKKDKDGKGGGFLSTILGGLGFLRLFGGVGKFGALLLGLLPGLGLLKTAIGGVASGFTSLIAGLGSAASALAGFAGKAASMAMAGAGKVAEWGKAGVNKVAEWGKAGVNKVAEWGKGAWNKGKNLVGLGENKAAQKGAGKVAGKVAQNQIGKIAGKQLLKTAGTRLVAGAGPAGAVLGAGMLGYEAGSYLNEKFNISDNLLDFGTNAFDNIFSALNGRATEKFRKQVRENPDKYTDRQKMHAAMTDLEDAKKAHEASGQKWGKREHDAMWRSIKNTYKIGVDDTATSLKKSQAKTDLNKANQNTIKEAEVEKRVDNDTAKKQQTPPAVINNSPVTNIYNGGGQGGQPTMSTHNTDNSYIRNLDGNQVSFAF